MSFNKQKAKTNYENSWLLETDNIETVLARIEAMSAMGCAELCVYNDSTKQLDSIKAWLIELDFDVTYHNGETDILLIEWGV